MPFVDKIYPGLTALVDKIEKRLEVRRDKRKIHFSERNTDLLFKHYIQEIESRNKREGAYFIRD